MSMPCPPLLHEWELALQDQENSVIGMIMKQIMERIVDRAVSKASSSRQAFDDFKKNLPADAGRFFPPTRM